MSVSLTPSSSLGFRRPLTQLVKLSLTITNHNSQPIAFKVKTTAPKLYCVRPNSGRVEPEESVEVAVMLQALKEEPPLNAKCKDKFLIQSTLITPEKETMPLHDIWSIPEGGEDRVHQQKLRVTYLPAEGQTLEEEDEGPAVPQAGPAPNRNESKFETVHPPANGHNQHPIPDFGESANAVRPLQPVRSITPAGDFSVAREDSREEPMHDAPHTVNIHAQPPSRSPSPFVNREHSPSPPAAPESVAIPVPIHMVETAPWSERPASPPRTVVENPVNVELVSQLDAAHAEIEQLRASIQAMSIAPPTEIRRRRPALSDDGSVADTDMGTMIDDGPIQQDGVPLQVVVVIALGVFVTTYLFF
ncbi:PapD-like protein [Infundibulicybe gibba]|nr:PapD-like protein [Infundibulicybe gibba]